MAAVIAVAIALLLSIFVVRVGTYTVPGGGDRLCVISKLPGAVSLRRGGQCLVLTPDGRFVLRIAALPGDTVSLRNAALSLGSDNATRDSRDAVASYLLMPRTPYSTRRQMIASMPRKKPLSVDSLVNVRLSIFARESSPEWKFWTYTHPLPNFDDPRVYPWNPDFPWNAYHWGPMRLPRKGDVIVLSQRNVSLYGPLVKTYEDAQLFVAPDRTYTFRRNYYMVLADDRDRLVDSRIYGPLPQDVIFAIANF